MKNLIDTSVFVGDILIAQLGSDIVDEPVTEYINEKQDLFLWQAYGTLGRDMLAANQSENITIKQLTGAETPQELSKSNVFWSDIAASATRSAGGVSISAAGFFINKRYLTTPDAERPLLSSRISDDWTGDSSILRDSQTTTFEVVKSDVSIGRVDRLQNGNVYMENPADFGFATNTTAVDDFLDALDDTFKITGFGFRTPSENVFVSIMFGGEDVYFFGLRSAYMEAIRMAKYNLARYVYCKWVEKEHIQTVGIGTVAPKGENSTRANPTRKIVVAWNQMRNALCHEHTYMRRFDNYAHRSISDICGKDKCGCTGYNRLNEIFLIRNSLGL